MGQLWGTFAVGALGMHWLGANGDSDTVGGWSKLGFVVGYVDTFKCLCQIDGARVTVS